MSARGGLLFQSENNEKCPTREKGIFSYGHQYEKIILETTETICNHETITLRTEGQHTKGSRSEN